MTWNSDDPEFDLDNVFDLARDEGPQVFTRGDVESVVIMRVEYDRLTSEKPIRTIAEHLLNMPRGDDPDLTRPRDVEVDS
jgi:hypothetical protein